MKLIIELERSNLNTLKKIVMQIKKACSQQNLFITFDNDHIKLITEFNNQNLSLISSFFLLGNEFFVSKQNRTIFSTRENNLIAIKIKDFNIFAQNIANINEKASHIQLMLSKEGEHRFIKIKWNEDEKVQTITRTEILLHFADIHFPQIDEKLFSMNIFTKDLNKLLDICHKRDLNLKVYFRITRSSGIIVFKIDNPSIKIAYDQLQVSDVNDKLPEVFSYSFTISTVHTKQLSNICAIDEFVTIGLLADFSLSLEFWESNEKQLIISTKTFVVPQLDELEIEEKVEEETRIQQELPGEDLQDVTNEEPEKQLQSHNPASEIDQEQN